MAILRIHSYSLIFRPVNFAPSDERMNLHLRTTSEEVHPCAKDQATKHRQQDWLYLINTLVRGSHLQEADYTVHCGAEPVLPHVSLDAMIRKGTYVL
jgi:hypothetical protein